MQASRMLSNAGHRLSILDIIVFPVDGVTLLGTPQFTCIMVIRRLVSALLIVMGVLPAMAQSHIDIIRQSPKDASWEQVNNSVNSFFDAFPSQTEKNRQGYKLWKRWEWFAALHQDTDGKIGSWTTYNDHALALIRSRPAEQAVNGSWISVGPSSISNNIGYLGRVECVGFHPTDANTLYVGSATGGLWKTTNLGTTWVPLTDHLPSISISGIAVHPSNGNILYVITGDGDGGFNWGYYVKERSSGVFKSTDGGINWQPTGLSFERSAEEVYGYKLLINPTNPNILFAITSSGIYRSIDGATTWTRVITGQFTDAEFRPGNPLHMVATAYGVDNLYLSTDGGVNWRQKDVPDGENMTRADLGVSASAPQSVYMLMGPQGSGNFRGYYRFNWTDSSFTLLTNTPNVFNGATDGSGGGGFPWWAIALGISPTNVNDQLVGGVIGRRSTNGGSTIFADHDIQHVDFHGYWYSPVDGSVYSVTDGGIMRSTDQGDTWTNLSVGLRITQYYRISGTAQNADMILGGTQDNGHYVRYSNTSQFKHTLTCCDGMDNAVDYTNSQILYMCTQDGGLTRSTDAGDTWTAINPEGSSWVAPVALHTTTPTTIFFAGNSGVWRSTNSGLSGWVNIGADGRGAMAQGTSNTGRFYTAGNNTTLRRSDNVNDATPAWTTISGNTGWPSGTGLSGSRITGIAVNPANSSEVWVSFSGYNAANKILRSTDGGSNWTNLTDALPNVPVHAIKFAGTGASGAFEIYIGTDIGVFYRSNTTADWIFFSNGLPRVMVTDIEINGTYIYAGTYGRGIWRSTLYSACPANLVLTSDLKGEQVLQAATSITADNYIFGGAGTQVHYRAGNYVKLNPGFEVLSGNIFKATIGPCNATLPLENKPLEHNNALPGALQVREGESKQRKMQPPSAGRN